MVKKICVITGGTGGIGFASAKELSKQYSVYICDVSADKIEKAVNELKADGMDADGMVCDISDKTQSDELARKASALGKVVGVIQLAGLTPTFAPAPDILKVDTIGPMNINESFYEVMDGGCIIVYWYARQCAYKFGREKRIRVMTVSPGVIRTQMSMSDFERSTSGMEGLDRTMSWCALSRPGRPGRPEEIAFLFSTIIDERNSYLTGTDIYLDGGCDAAGYHGQREWYPGNKN
ncbi:MAG: SDR family oxidoreductase [Lachnospiraceae bacterium]|nr:SDR family oxidoreductase [Lachnospiraceae bacterium]